MPPDPTSEINPGVPTTAGTGSEVSPNSILLDTSDHLKKGVNSRSLMPDVACIDSLLTSA